MNLRTQDDDGIPARLLKVNFDEIARGGHSTKQSHQNQPLGIIHIENIEGDSATPEPMLATTQNEQSLEYS